MMDVINQRAFCDMTQDLPFLHSQPEIIAQYRLAQISANTTTTTTVSLQSAVRQRTASLTASVNSVGLIQLNSSGLAVSLTASTTAK